MRTSFAVLCGAVLLLIGSAAQGAIILHTALSNAQETLPPARITTTSTGAPRPASFGFADFILNDAQTQLTMMATIFNIDVTGSQTSDTFDNLVNAHIHAPALLGANAGVVWGFFGAPDNDNNPDQFILTPFSTGVGGVFQSIWDAPEGNAGTTLLAQLPSITSGRAYLNFHTVQFTGGEIRGQLVRVTEPSILMLLLVGLGVLVPMIRRAPTP